MVCLPLQTLEAAAREAGDEWATGSRDIGMHDHYERDSLFILTLATKSNGNLASSWLRPQARAPLARRWIGSAFVLHCPR
mgnify:CR=1 FL=1